MKTILTVQYNFAGQLLPARLVELTENCLEVLKKRILRSIRLTNIPAMNHLNERQCDYVIQGGSNMTGTDLCVNKPHCAAAVRP